jgi:DTW domain-containing protein YfiP
MSEDAPRPLCTRCRRPAPLCYCAHLPSLPTRARVVILQHPRERRVPIGTARMAHLALPNSELHTGIEFDAHPRIAALRAQPGTALLFPGAGARDPAQVHPHELEHLIVVDGTWAQARKVLKLNPGLRALPRIGLKPERPGNYRIRAEPSADCLATIEAISAALGLLERDREKFAGMLAAFDFMVDQQLARMAARLDDPEIAQRARTKRPRLRRPSDEQRLLANLREVVCVHAEVNAHPRALAVPGDAELLHLVARRASGEEFRALLAPRRPLAPNAWVHLGVSSEEILAGETLESARARWAAFKRPGELHCGWGQFARDQLARESFASGGYLDLRLVVARRLQARPGSPAEALARLGAKARASDATDRATRVVDALEQLVDRLATSASRQRGPP